MKYRIFLLESERGWGQKRWTEVYDTVEEAWERIKQVNDRNVSIVAPDWYMQAEDRIEVVLEN